jgi:3-isopropylmalate dehydrogenase
MAIRDAVQAVLREGYRTVDLMEDGCTQTGCGEFGDLVAERIVKTGK